MEDNTKLQSFVDKHFFNLFLFTLTFGILLYDAIGFDYTDEICALLLFLLFGYHLFRKPQWPVNKAFLFTLCAFFFYLVYSIVIRSNATAGILSDFVIQIKPYLAFFCVYSLAPLFSKNRKVVLKLVSLAFWIFLLIVAAAELYSPGMMPDIMGHASYFAAAVVSISLCYLYSTDGFSLKTKLCFLFLLSVGLISGRAKFYGFYAICLVGILYFSNLKRLKLNLRTIIVLVGMLAAIVLVTWNKIELYFIQNIAADSEEKDLIARFILYVTSIEIFRDYFPFGSGFGSFATYSSGVYYSDIYVKYGIEGVWGISRQFYSYIADTYYPSLAQFGVTGVMLYISFWLHILLKGYSFFKKKPRQLLKYFFTTILITMFFAIEGTSDSTFTTHRGFFILMLLAMNLSFMRSEVTPSTEKQTE